ncbi:hypothetical protein J0H58_33850 [bacterium]|nr:hypothetical protein [bacterium]
MPLTAAAVERLAALGVTSDAELDFWRRTCAADGETFVWRYIEKLEADSVAYRRWFPQLCAFADDCRRARPALELSPVESEQRRVLLTKMREFTASGDRGAILNRRPFQVAIVLVPPVGLAAAEEVFGDAGAVILTEAEWERWRAEVYPQDAEPFSWYARVWWALHEGLPEDGEWLRREYPLPPGNEYWLVVAGEAWGSLAGGANHELWRWDGTRAEYVETYQIDTY